MNINYNNTRINFNKVYLYKTKPEIIPFLKRFIGFLVILTMIIYFVGYGLAYFKVKKIEESNLLVNYFRNKVLLWVGFLFFFISLFIVYKSLKSYNSLQEKYSVSTGWNILIITFFSIITIILWKFITSEVKEELQKTKWLTVKRINDITNLVITIILFIKFLIIFIQFLLKPKLDIKKVRKLNFEIMKVAEAVLKGKKYVVDESIYE